MTDLNQMMRLQAQNGLQAALDKAVTDGDTEAARKVSADLAALAVSTAPKAPPFGDVEIRAVLDKQDWFGTDPKKSAKAMEFGKTMDPKKFATAELFAAAVVKAVDEEFKAPVKTEEDEDGEEPPKDEDGENPPAGKKARRTDAPGEGDALNRSGRSTRSGPWTKLSDAPGDVQKEIRRQADKFVPANAGKERRETFVTKALESHFTIHQRKAGK